MRGRAKAVALQVDEDRVAALGMLPVAAEERAAVLDLGGHEPPGEPQAGLLVEARPVLGGPQLDVLVPVAHGVAEEPAAVAVPSDGNPAPHQLVQGGRGQVDVAHDDDLRGLLQPGGSPARRRSTVTTSVSPDLDTFARRAWT